MAISPGVSPPIGSPMGARSLGARRSKPRAATSSRTRATLRRLPMSPR